MEQRSSVVIMTHKSSFTNRNKNFTNSTGGPSNSAMQRLFVALPLPPHIKEELRQWQLQNKSILPFRKWTHPEDLHITVQFLGDTSNEQLEQMKHHLASIKHAPFQLQLSKFGSFGPLAAPRILWASVSGELQALTQLHKKVLEQTEKVGFIAEERRYQPHITVARHYENVTNSNHLTKNAADKATMNLQEILHNSSLPTLEWQATEYTIMKTTLNKQPSYSVVHSFSL